jgi:hypothetical protein
MLKGIFTCECDMFSAVKYFCFFNNFRDVSVTAMQPQISSSVSNGQLLAMEATTSSVTAKHRRRYKTDKCGMFGNRPNRTRKGKQNLLNNEYLKIICL